jgi:8-oxo-dGTP pyrophosphatase MutT (NUDIX family)
MSIFSHDIYDNIRTRTIVLHRGCVLVIPAGSVPEASEVWRLPGGGLEPHESLAECARREVLEETGISVRVGRIAFLLEWVVPRFALTPEPDPDCRGHGYGLEVFHYATPEEPVPDPRPEEPGAPPPRWVPLTEVPALPLWPKEIKVLCQRLLRGQSPEGSVSIVGQLESPLARTEHDPFA